MRSHIDEPLALRETFSWILRQPQPIRSALVSAIRQRLDGCSNWSHLRSRCPSRARQAVLLASESRAAHHIVPAEIQRIAEEVAGASLVIELVRLVGPAAYDLPSPRHWIHIGAAFEVERYRNLPDALDRLFAVLRISAEPHNGFAALPGFDRLNATLGIRLKGALGLALKLAMEGVSLPQACAQLRLRAETRDEIERLFIAPNTLRSMLRKIACDAMPAPDDRADTLQSRAAACFVGGVRGVRGLKQTLFRISLAPRGLAATLLKQTHTQMSGFENWRYGNGDLRDAKSVVIAMEALRHAQTPAECVLRELALPLPLQLMVLHGDYKGANYPPSVPLFEQIRQALRYVTHGDWQINIREEPDAT